MWLMQSDNMLQHIPEKMEIQEKEKKSTKLKTNHLYSWNRKKKKGIRVSWKESRHEEVRKILIPSLVWYKFSLALVFQVYLASVSNYVFNFFLFCRTYPTFASCGSVNTVQSHLYLFKSVILCISPNPQHYL